MKINVEFLGLPMVSDVVGQKRLELVVSGKTVKDVIDELIKQYGPKVKNAFYDAEGKFDVMIQVAHNGKSFIPVEKHQSPLLSDGDTLMLMILLAGG